MKTIIGHFIRAAERQPDEVAVRTLHGSLDYAGLASRVAAGVRQLRELGIEPGDTIVCYTEDTVPLSLLYLTAAAVRAIPVPLSPIFSASYLTALARKCSAKAVYTTSDLVARATMQGLPTLTYGGELTWRQTKPTARDSLFGESSDPALTEVALFRPDACGPLDAALAILSEQSAEVGLNDVALLQPTSGSTGEPKLVVRPHVAFSRYAKFVGDEVCRGLPLDEPIEILAVNALTHAFAGHMFTMAMRLGAEVVVPSSLDAGASLGEVRQLNPDVLPMTPRVLRSFRRQQINSQEPADARLFGDNAKVLLSAGAKGDANAFRRLQSEGVEVIEFYGSTEASIVACTPYGEWREDSAGVPVADVQIHTDRAGELRVKSPGLMRGYLGEASASQDTIDEAGFLATGDVGAVGGDGYLRIVGRRRDVFNTPEGSNIYPERIETMVESFDWVEQAILIGDDRPFLTAHIVVKDMETSGGGFIAPERAPHLYEMAGQALQGLNSRLEVIEEVVAIALYDRCFECDAYKALPAGKVRRNRRNFHKEYRDSIELLYSQNLDISSVMLVPPRERRLRSRANGKLSAKQHQANRQPEREQLAPGQCDPLRSRGAGSG